MVRSGWWRAMRIHTGLRGKGGTKRGHCQQNLGLEITASVTICQVRNKGCGLNGLRADLGSEPERNRGAECPVLAQTQPRNARPLSLGKVSRLGKSKVIFGSQLRRSPDRHLLCVSYGAAQPTDRGRRLSGEVLTFWVTL